MDKAKLNRRWAARHGLAMPLICDPTRAVSMAFGVARWRGGAVSRITCLIEADGTVRKVYSEVGSKRGHAAAVLEDCRAIWG